MKEFNPELIKNIGMTNEEFLQITMLMQYFDEHVCFGNGVWFTSLRKFFSPKNYYELSE